MKNIFLVTEGELSTSRRIEKKLIDVNKASGIIFVSVRVSPGDELRPHPVYVVTVGCTRDVDPRAMQPLVLAVLRDEVDAGLHFAVTAFAGITRATK